MKLHIRKARPTDVEALAALTLEGVESKNFKYTGTNAPRTKEWNAGLKKELARKKPKQVVLLAFLCDGALAGSASMRLYLGRMRHRADIGWMVRPGFQGKGVGTQLLKAVVAEARRLKLKRLEAEAAAENTASIRLAQKAGFTVEGIKRKALLLDDGSLVDTLMLGKLL